MRKNTAAAITTTCLGLAAAGTAIMLSNGHSTKHKASQLKRKTGKALHQIGSFLENASSMMR